MTRVRIRMKRGPRAAIVWLAIIGLLGQFLAPLSFNSAGAFPSGDSYNAALIPICTPYGVQFIPTGEEGQAPEERGGPVCPFCFLGQSADGFLTPGCRGITPPAVVDSAFAVDHGALAYGQGGQGAFRSRAPPILL